MIHAFLLWALNLEILQMTIVKIPVLSSFHSVSAIPYEMATVTHSYFRDEKTEAPGDLEFRKSKAGRAKMWTQAG